MRSWTATVTRRGGWAIVDGGVVTLSVLGGLYLSSYLSGVTFDIKFTPLKFVIILAAHICALIATSAIQLKTFRRWQTYRDDLRAIGSGVILASLGVTVLFILFQTTSKPLWVALSDSVSPGILILVTLSGARALERTSRRLFYNKTTAIFVGIDPQWHESLGQARQVLGDDWRLVLVSPGTSAAGAAGADVPPGIENWDGKKLASWLEEAVKKGHKNLFIFGQNQPRSPLHANLIEKAYGNLIPITNMVDFYEEILEKSPLFEDAKHWYSSTGLPKHSKVELALKRLIDIVIGIPLAIAIIPVIGILGVVIRKESCGPAIFRQERVGIGGKTFTLYKLRTMTVHEDDSDRWPNFEASKVTKFGGFLRRSGLDELPQIYNVLLGNMSFIGPRPARPKVTQRHINRLPYYAVVKSVKPGISGWAQLHQGQDAGDDTMFEKTRYNLYYAKHFSIWLVILIYIRTFSQLINGKKRESVYMKTHLASSVEPKQK